MTVTTRASWSHAAALVFATTIVVACTGNPIEQCIASSRGAAYAVDDERALVVSSCFVESRGSGTRIWLRERGGRARWGVRLPGTHVGSAPGQGLAITDTAVYLHVVRDDGARAMLAYSIADGVRLWADDLVLATGQPLPKEDAMTAVYDQQHDWATRVAGDLVLELVRTDGADTLFAITRSDGSIRWKRELADVPRPPSSSTTAGWLDVGDDIALVHGLADAPKSWAAITIADGVTVAQGAVGESACVTGSHLLAVRDDALVRIEGNLVTPVAVLGEGAYLAGCATYDSEVIVFARVRPEDGGSYSTRVARYALPEGREVWRSALPQLSSRAGADGDDLPTLAGELPRYVLVATAPNTTTQLHAIDLANGEIIGASDPLVASAVHLHRHANRTVVVLDEDDGKSTTLASFDGDSGKMLAAAMIAPFDHYRVTAHQIREDVLWVTNVHYHAALDLHRFELLAHDGDTITITPAPDIVLRP